MNHHIHTYIHTYRYNLGDGSFSTSLKDGDQLVRALRIVSQETVSLRNIDRIQELIRKQCGLEEISVVVEVGMLCCLNLSISIYVYMYVYLYVRP